MESEWLENSLSESTHSKETAANDANDAVVLRVERHLVYRILGRRKVSEGSDDLVLLPKEVDQTENQNEYEEKGPFHNQMWRKPYLY